MAARSWLFTLNNPTLPYPTLDDFGQDVRYVIFQREVGESGTPHLQGYVEFKKPQRVSRCKTFLSRAHWEKRRGSQADAIAYCSKEETRQEGPWEFGEKSGGQGKRSDIDELKKSLEDRASLAEISQKHTAVFLRYHKGIEKYIQLNYPTRHTGQKPTTWIITGRTELGKTSFATTLALTPTDIYWKDQAMEKWWNQYNGETTVIFDEFYGWEKISTLNRLLDPFPFRAQTKNGDVEITATQYIFISNSTPDKWWPRLAAQQDSPFNSFLRRVTWFVHFYDFQEYEKFDNYKDYELFSFQNP